VRARKITQHVRIAELPDKSDCAVARSWLLGVLPSEDYVAGAAALTRLLKEQYPLDQAVREILAEEIKLAAEGKGRVLKFKSGKRRMDPNRDLFIALAVWEHFLVNPQDGIGSAIATVAQEIFREDKVVKNAWQKLQRHLKKTDRFGRALPTREK
jgi:hypothetical protein